MKALLIVISAFLIGSIPTGQIIARSRGIDIQKTGSGNIGATNVLRTTGKIEALITLIGDMLKGTVPLLIAKYAGLDALGQGITGIFAVLGHNFSIFLKFRGGKGVATSLGMLFVYAPLAAVVTVILWCLVFAITRISSLGALISFGILPLSMILFDTREKLPVAILITILMYIRHKENIRRLIKGEEKRIIG